MLYDPKWEKPAVKADPFSLESLIAWLETKPATEFYAWHCAGECLLGQWVLSIDKNGCEAADWKNSFEYVVHGQTIDLTRYEDVALGGEANFGAALTRARAIATL